MSSQSACRYPNYRKELLKLENEDQSEIRNNFHRISLIESEDLKQQEYEAIARKCHSRAHHAVEILEAIQDPNAENIGEDGVDALLLLIQHSYLDIMKKVLPRVEAFVYKEKNSSAIQSIPSVRDRIMVLEARKQIFGTQWFTDKRGKPFLIETENFNTVNQRRAEYGLGPVRKPVNLAVGAVKYPLGNGLATENDQKAMTDEEYAQYSQFYLTSLLS